jgi:hypothetical protein
VTGRRHGQLAFGSFRSLVLYALQTDQLMANVIDTSDSGSVPLLSPRLLLFPAFLLILHLLPLRPPAAEESRSWSGGVPISAKLQLRSRGPVSRWAWATITNDGETVAERGAGGPVRDVAGGWFRSCNHHFFTCRCALTWRWSATTGQ